MQKAVPAKLAGLYDNEFYKDQVAPSLGAARLILGHLWTYLQPESVVDVGCGRGSWLAACHELGSATLIGLDGDWNSQAAMIDPAIRFRAVDLNQPFALDRRVDLAISVEVAEHLEPASSTQFVNCLTEASDMVVFGAAYEGQGGTNHINEQRHSWWARLFSANRYVPFDLFRPYFWSHERIHFWYRQNTFLYVRQDSGPYGALRARGISELPDVGFVDCIHPLLYGAKAGLSVSFRTHVNDLFPSLVRAVRRRLR
jgi:SAM-dependent methyltransferase